MVKPQMSRVLRAGLRSASVGLLLVLGLTAATCPDDKTPGPIVDPGNELATCTASDQCPAGNICASGACVLGECDPNLEDACDAEGLDSPYCCKVWELCSQGPLTTVCVNDPESRGIGCAADDVNCTPCEVQDDCAAGQFCSGAVCFDAAGRTNCTSSFQCPGGERCDPTVFLCVPDRGGCTFCGPDFPELCCEEGQVCSEQTGFCQDVPEPECDDDTPCSAGLFCDALQRCVQCAEDDDCGPGLACDEGAGTCFSVASVCDSDDDCQGNKRCAVERRECVIPLCEVDSDCRMGSDSRWVCDTASFSCFLPPASCTESDEGNNSTGEATALENSSYRGTLCRGDVDYLSFPVVPDRRYSVEVRFTGSGQPGIAVALLDTNQLVESSAVFTQTQAFVELAGVTGADESGLFWVKVTGNNADRDSWAYTVDVTEGEPSAPAECPADGDDNDAIEDAGELASSVGGVTHVLSRCGTDDVDFYRIPVAPQHGLEVLISNFYNAEGNLNAELYKEPSATLASRVDQATGVTDIESLDAPEGPAAFWLKVSLGTTSGALEDQRYSVTLKQIPRPAACSADSNEPADDAPATAPILELVADPESGAEPSGQTSALRCNAQDVDHHAFTVPAGRSAAVRLRFNHGEGNLKLEVLNAAGALIPNGSSDVSTATSEIDEQVSVPGNPTDAVTYVARVKLSGTASAILAQPYTLEVETFDDAVCLASEPVGGNNSFETGVCLGAEESFAMSFAPCTVYSSEPLVAASGLVCGSSDSDFYRVGKLKNDQTLHAVLTYDKALGAMDLVRSTKSSAAGAVAESTVTDADSDGRIEMWHVETSETGKEYAVRVKPKGTVGHEQQPYTLTVEVGPECDADDNDAGAAQNEKPSQATALAVGLGEASTVEATRCHNDVDVYELIALEDEQLTFSLTPDDPSPTGLVAELGLRPSDLNTIPAAVATAAAGGEAATFLSDRRQILYLTVRPRQGQSPAVLVTGGYTLSVSVAPAPAGDGG